MPLSSVWTATPALTPTLTHDRHFLLLIWFFPHSLVALWEIIFKFDVSLLLLLLPLLLLRLLSRSLHLFYFISLYVGCVLFCILFMFLTSFVVVFFALYNLSCVAEDAQRRRLAVSVASSSASVWAWRVYHENTPPSLFLSLCHRTHLVVNGKCFADIFANSNWQRGNIVVFLYCFCCCYSLPSFMHTKGKDNQSNVCLFSVFYFYFTSVVVFVKSSRVHKSAMARLSDMLRKVLNLQMHRNSSLD